MDDTEHELGSNGRQPKSGQMDGALQQKRGTTDLNYLNGRQEVIDYKIHTARGRTWNSQYYFNGVYYFRKEAYNRRGQAEDSMISI